VHKRRYKTLHWRTKQSIQASQPLPGRLIVLPGTCSGLSSRARCCSLQMLVAMCWPQQPPQYSRSPPVNKSVSSCVQWLTIPSRLNSSPRQNSTRTTAATIDAGEGIKGNQIDFWNYTVSQKTSPTFLIVTLKPITRFLQFLVRIFLTQLAIKW